MRSCFSALLGCVLLMNLVGCSGYGGEWLEDGISGSNGELESANGGRRMALQFSPPLSLHYGEYSERLGAVDPGSVESDLYSIEEGKIAKFGAMTATRDGDHMTVNVGFGKAVTFTRLRGRSIFPPMVDWVDAQGPAQTSSGVAAAPVTPADPLASAAP